MASEPAAVPAHSAEGDNRDGRHGEPRRGRHDRRRGDHRRTAVRLRQRRRERHTGRIEDGFRVERRRAGLHGRLAADWLLHRRLPRGTAGRSPGPPEGDDAGRRGVSRRRARAGLRACALALRTGAILRRHGRRRRQRAVPCLHLRGGPGRDPRPARDDAASHDHHRPDRRLRRQLRAGAGRRSVDQQLLGRHRGVAVDVSDAGRARGDLPGRAAVHSREPAVSRVQGTTGGGRGRAANPVRRAGGRRQARQPSAPASTRGTARACAT